MKVICDFVQQHHERKKDNEYRNREEERRLILENASRGDQLIRDKIAILQEAGVPESEIRRMVLHGITSPLENLGRHIDSNLLTGAEIVED